MCLPPTVPTCWRRTEERLGLDAHGDLARLLVVRTLQHTGKPRGDAVGVLPAFSSSGVGRQLPERTSVCERVPNSASRSADGPIAMAAAAAAAASAAAAAAECCRKLSPAVCLHAGGKGAVAVSFGRRQQSGGGAAAKGAVGSPHAPHTVCCTPRVSPGGHQTRNKQRGGGGRRCSCAGCLFRPVFAARCRSMLIV